MDYANDPTMVIDKTTGASMSTDTQNVHVTNKMNLGTEGIN